MDTKKDLHPSLTNWHVAILALSIIPTYVIQLMEAVLEIDKEKSQSQMESQEFECIVLPSRNGAIRCHDFLVKACGYLDGKAFSARLVNNVAMVHSIIGDLRVKIFFKR
jgi:hypothetical protein